MEEHRSEQSHRSEKTGSAFSSGVLTRRGALTLAFLLAAAAPAQASADLVLIPALPMLIGLMVLFVGLVIVTNSLIFKPIFRALDDRALRVEGARKRAEEVDSESDALLQRYEASIREARAEAETSRKNKLGHAREEQLGMAEAARAEAEVQVEAARSGLEAALADARQALQASSQDIARSVAARVIGREL